MNQTTKFMLIIVFVFLCGLALVSLVNANPKKQPMKPKNVVAQEDKFQALRVVDTMKVSTPLPIREQAYHYVVDSLKLSRNHALGLIANVDRESKWTVGTHTKTLVGGLFQWHGKRFSKMEQAVPDWKKNWKGQIAYAITEDVGPQWCAKYFATAQSASAWWCKYWERPANIEGSIAKNNHFLASYNF